MTRPGDQHVAGQSKLEQALAAVQAGDLDSARRQFEELVMDDPHDPLALYNLGLCYNEAGNYDAARKTLLSCLALDPGEANTYVALGLAEAKLGQMADAEVHLVQAAALEPDNPYAMGYLNGGPKSRQSLVLGDTATVSLVRKSFDLIDSGLKISKALEQVRREGLKSRDGHVLSVNTFRTMLMNKVYVGYIVAFGMTVRGDFDPIVTEDVFYRVQPKLHRKAKTTQVRYLRDNPEFPLRGVVRCPTCGHMMTASLSKGNGGKYGYYSCSNCKKSRFRKEVLENWFVQGLGALNLDKEAVNALSAAVDANLEENRKWVRTETTRINNKITSLREEKDAIIQKSINGTLPDDVVKAWFDRTSGEEESLKGQLALTVTSTLDTPDVLKRGLEILEHLDLFWEKSNLSTRQQLQGFVFPQGVTARKPGFGTDPIALCLRSDELPASVITSVVGPPGFEPRTKWL